MSEEYKFKANKIITIVRDVLFIACLAVFMCWRLFTRVTYWKMSFPFFLKLDEAVLNVYLNYLSPMLLVCIVLGFLSTRPSVRKILVFVVLIVVGKLVAVANDESYFFLGILLVLAANGISAKKILGASICINIPLLLATVIASQRGIIENVIEAHRNREYLGYTWTTTPVMIFSYCVFAYLIIRKGKISIVEYLILNVMNLWFFYKTNTRFAFLLVFLSLAFFIVYRVFYENNRRYNFERNTIIAMPWLFFSIIYVVSASYDPDNRILSKINSVLSNRLRQCQYSLNLFGLKPFGQKIEWVTYGNATPNNPATYVDTAYLQTILKFGYISLILLLLLSSFIIYRAYKEKKYYIALVFAFVMLFGLFEQQLYWFEYDVLLLLSFADWESLSKDSILDRIGVFTQKLPRRVKQSC